MGIKMAARAANKLLEKALLKPLLQQVQEWAAASHSNRSNIDSSNETEEEDPNEPPRRNPLDCINVFSHDFADRRLVTLVLRINCALHCSPSDQPSNAL